MNSMDSKIKISVALCTYNGERFLREQLESIANQSHLPDELIVCDDGSTDGTRAILEEFVKVAPFCVKVIFNTENLGYVKNFEKAISLCSGDLIFLSDQDDRWREDKVALMQEIFSNPAIGMAFSNASIMDEHGQLTGELLWDAAHFNAKAQQYFLHGEAYKILYLKNIVSGCTMAFRRQLWHLIRPLPKDIPFIHDAWIALMSAIVSEVTFIDKPLIQYRLHAQQSAALERKKTSVNELMLQVRNNEKFQQYQRHLEQLRILRQRILNLQDHIVSQRYDYLLKCIEEHERHLNVRINLSPRFFVNCVQVLRELASGRYHRFSNGFKSVFADLLKSSA